MLSEIDLEAEKIFDKGAVWQEIIQNLSFGRISEEQETREGLDQFSTPTAEDPDLADLSLYSLHPRFHAKVYNVRDTEVALDQLFSVSDSWQERYRNRTTDSNVLAVVLRQMGRPKWSASDLIVDSEHVLIVVYHEVDQGLLFINSSVSAEGLYDAVVSAIAPQAATLSMAQVRRVVRRLRHQRVFNFGMRNIQASNSAESYRIIAGPNAQATIDPVDARLYRQGHVFMTGDVEGQKVTIGYSSGSKVWASAQERIPGLLAWCRAIGREIRVDTAIVTNSGLDYVPTGDVTATLPPNIVLAQWNREAFDIESPARVEYTGDDGRVQRSLLMDLDPVDRPATVGRLPSGVGSGWRTVVLLHQVQSFGGR